jgi:hypothetical protein
MQPMATNRFLPVSLARRRDDIAWIVAGQRCKFNCRELDDKKSNNKRSDLLNTEFMLQTNIWRVDMSYSFLS